MRFFIVLILLISPTAYSASIKIGSETLEIPIPNGYCELDNNHPADSRVVKYLVDANSGFNEVLLVVADCEQLISWRKLELPSLNDYGYVLSPSSLIMEKQSMTMASFLSEMEATFEKQGTEIMDKAIGKVKEIVEKHLSNVKLNETKDLGLLARDEYALYLGILQNLQTESGEEKNLLGIWGMTLVEGKIVNLYLWKNYRDEQSADALELLTNAWVSTVHKAN